MQLALATLFQRYRVGYIRKGSNAQIDFGFEMHPKGAINTRMIRL